MAELPGKVSRRAPVRAARPVRPASPQAIPTKFLLIGGGGLLLLITVAIAYGPIMRYRSVSVIDGGATIHERVEAAGALYARNDGTAFSVFQERLTSPDPLAREASASGMALLAIESGVHGISATEELTHAIAKADAAGKCMFAQQLGQVAKAIVQGNSDKKFSDDDTKRLAMIADALIPETKHADAKVRSATVDALGNLPQPRVCNTLIGVATNDTDAEVKTKARKGILLTTLPDAVGNLLQASASSDTDLANDAATAFKKVREKAKSADLLPFVSSPNEMVRKEIVTLFGKRFSDPRAAEGVALALKDSSPDIRKLALKSIQAIGLSGPASQLLPLMNDADETVRVQCAATLGELSDEGSKKIVLEAFAGNPSGDTLKALSKALERRSNGKDLAAIAVLIEQMNKHPDGFAGIRDVLLKMTNVLHDPKREAERMKWDAARWNAWWDNIAQREKIKADALDKLRKADARKQEDKKYYAELGKLTSDAFELLDKCLEMCKKDDSEDNSDITAIQNKYKGNKYQFEKFQVLDEYRGKK